MNILLIRHGQTDWNAQDKKIGDYDVPLNEQGIKDAEMIAEKTKGLKCDMVFSSPLTRAKQTAKIIYNSRKVPPQISILEQLKEVSLGNFQGKTGSQINKIFPDFDTLNRIHRQAINAPDIDEEVVLVRKNIIPAISSLDPNGLYYLVTHKIRIWTILKAFNIPSAEIQIGDIKPGTILKLNTERKNIKIL